MPVEFSAFFQPMALGVLLLVVLAVFIAFSVAFLYHWKEYGLHVPVVKTASSIYLTVSIFLFFTAVISYLGIIW